MKRQNHTLCILIVVMFFSSIAENRAPVAVIKITGKTLSNVQISVKAGETVHFDGNSSYDPDGDPLTFLWDFGDGKKSTAAITEHTYAANGLYTTILTVDDGHASTSLLHNKTPDNLTIPDGWKLGCKQNFEADKLINQWDVAQSQAGDALEVWALGTKQTTKKARTGKHSITQHLAVSGNGGNWGVKLPSTAKEVYVSWYTNNDSFPDYKGFYYEGGDLMVAQFRVTDGNCLLNFCCNSAPKGTDSADILWQTEAGAVSAESPTRTLKKVFTDFDGRWHQWEIYFKPNTQTGGNANKNGILKVWHDGILWTNLENYNLNGTLNMTGMSVAIHGSVTAILWSKNATDEASCDKLIANGTFECGNGGFGCANGRTWELMNSICPGSAPPHAWDRYADDFILLYR